eukprot:7690341-Pyramimonas_sp.AAC.1
MRGYAMPCCVLPYYSKRHALNCDALPLCATPCHATLYKATRCIAILLCRDTIASALMYIAVMYFAVRYAAWHLIALHMYAFNKHLTVVTS